jgi:hypothetical protein
LAGYCWSPYSAAGSDVQTFAAIAANYPVFELITREEHSSPK